MTNSIVEFEDADLVLVTGSNTTAQHPLIGTRIINAHARGAKLIVVDPRIIPLAEHADLHLRHNIGTDVAVFNGLMNVIIADGLHDRNFIMTRTEGFEALHDVVSRYTPNVVQAITGVPAGDIVAAARMYAQADKAMIAYAMGITQHTTGTDNVKVLADLAMLTGHLGRPSTGINPLRGQNNVQGACDMGALPNVYCGYQSVAAAEIRDKFETAWGRPLNDKPGLTITDMMSAALRGDLKAMFIMGENPMMSDPDTTHIERALANLDFLVVQDIFVTETARLADVVLPGAAFSEKTGTYTNTERRVQLAHAATAPPQDARADWEIICALSMHAGYPMVYDSPRDIMREINTLTPSYAGITYERLEACHGLQWPCPTPEHPGTPILHRDKFTKGLGTFLPCDFKPLAEVPDEEFDFILTTGRISYQYHTGTMTRRTNLLEREAPHAQVQIHPEDARRLSIGNCDLVEISSRRGTVRMQAEITDQVPRKVLFTTFHFHEAPVNKLTNPACDPISKIPEYKGCAVMIRRIS